MTTVFVSWSGPASRLVAAKLAEWLPYVVPSVSAWISQHDIKAGTLWDQELSNSLASTDCAILVLTQQNQTSPWLLYEAGVLSRSARLGRIIPYRVDLELSDVAAPIARFQGVDSTLAGTKNLVEALNGLSSAPIPEPRLHDYLDVFWPRLQVVLEDQRASVAPKLPQPRDIHESLDEILALLRERGERVSTPRQPSEPDADPVAALRLKVRLLTEAVESMEAYERNGGGASTEVWWDAYVDRRRMARDEFAKVLALAEQASKIKLD